MRVGYVEARTIRPRSFVRMHEGGTRLGRAKERERLGKEIERAQNAVNQSARKLGDGKFVQNAPPDKVEAEKARLAEYRQKVASLNAALVELE